MTWQPIESAPINKVILVWADYMDDPELATVRSDGVVEDREPGYPSKIHGATHWMPLPEPPAS